MLPFILMDLKKEVVKMNLLHAVRDRTLTFNDREPEVIFLIPPTVYVLERWSEPNGSLTCDITDIFTDSLEAKGMAKYAALEAILEMKNPCLLIREVKREDLKHFHSWKEFVLNPQNIS